MNPPVRRPQEIAVHRGRRTLELTFPDGETIEIPFELLRVYSPSAEVRGHGTGPAVLQLGKQDVLIDAVEPVGHYGIKPIFSDGHASGIYTWTWLYELGTRQAHYWQDYCDRLAAASLS